MTTSPGAAGEGPKILPRDPASVAGKSPVLAERAQLLVVGAGPAGLAAAAEATELGIAVVVVDEHPVDPALMGLDVPLHFGQRMDGSVRNPTRTLEQIIASDSGLEHVYSLGVDARLGTSLWGLFAGEATFGWPSGLVAGLADQDKAWLVSCERVVVATGRRDMGLAFPGWELPGVLGAAAAHVLLERYDAFAGTRMAVLGSGVEALMLALAALDRGVAIAAVIETAPAVIGPADLTARLVRAGVPLLTSCVPLAALGGDNGVTALRVAEIDRNLAPVPGTERDIACDTICLAVGAVPDVEALGAAGCRLTHRRERGGFVPELDAALQTSIAGIFAAGDVTGLFQSKTRDTRIARREGRLAALGAALSLGAIDAAGYAARAAGLGSSPQAPTAVSRYRECWTRSLVNAGGEDVVVCLCEQVTRGDLLGLRPPRYLGCTAPKMAARSLRTLVRAQPVNQDQVKRLTRAGMGQCQGRRCREQIALLLADATGVPVESVPLAAYRPPLRPLPLAVIQAAEESSDLSAHWSPWFGIPSQWRPYWDLDGSGDGLDEVGHYGK